MLLFGIFILSLNRLISASRSSFNCLISDIRHSDFVSSLESLELGISTACGQVDFSLDFLETEVPFCLLDVSVSLGPESLLAIRYLLLIAKVVAEFANFPALVVVEFANFPALVVLEFANLRIGLQCSRFS